MVSTECDVISQALPGLVEVTLDQARRNERSLGHPPDISARDFSGGPLRSGGFWAEHLAGQIQKAHKERR